MVMGTCPTYGQELVSLEVTTSQTVLAIGQ